MFPDSARLKSESGMRLDGSGWKFHHFSFSPSILICLVSFAFPLRPATGPPHVTPLDTVFPTAQPVSQLRPSAYCAYVSDAIIGARHLIHIDHLGEIRLLFHVVFRVDFRRPSKCLTTLFRPPSSNYLPIFRLRHIGCLNYIILQDQDRMYLGTQIKFATVSPSIVQVNSIVGVSVGTKKGSPLDTTRSCDKPSQPGSVRHGS
ncbi:hypothetical protein F5Y05DRAFT_364664 [Hypoxylon sp. FL0543]|nr:hypothetical protein F5Y05DRAFT_364664 [Hypoxylon sp. FL0543]